jgi:hypothetical protein
MVGVFRLVRAASQQRGRQQIQAQRSHSQALVLRPGIPLFQFVRPEHVPRTQLTYGLLRRAGLDGLLDFIRQTVQVSVQPVVHVALGLVRREVPDQGSLSRFLAKSFD